jgi:hypothetical protein
MVPAAFKTISCESHERRSQRPMAVPAIAGDVVAKPISDANNISFMV